MKPILDKIPGYKVFEYALVLNPHEELRNKIRFIQQHFYEKFKVKPGFPGKPYISIVNFVQYEMFEERIINHLKTIAMGYQPFKIELKDFGSFPSHTIFINITSRLPVQSLVKQVRKETQRLMKFDADNKPYFMLEPHLTIARKLVPWQYEQGWLEYSHKHFTGRFIADGMLLLKRSVGEKRYEIVRHFEFQNLPITIKQGALFS